MGWLRRLRDGAPLRMQQDKERNPGKCHLVLGKQGREIVFKYKILRGLDGQTEQALDQGLDRVRPCGASCPAARPNCDWSRGHHTFLIRLGEWAKLPMQSRDRRK